MNKTINLLNVAVASLVLFGCVSTGSNIKEQSSTTNTSTCEEHEATANKAHNFGARNFYKSYAVPNDLQGARAQLFLIEEGLKGRPIGSFAVNYKAAERSYNQSLSAAKAMNCDTSKYPLSPINAFRKGVKILEEKSK
jgi:hypothetical protein